MDHGILKGIIAKILKDERLAEMLGRIIDSNESAKGIPVGNLTSQLFANLYLNELDNYVKHTLRMKYYIRYMDDFLIFSTDKEELRRALMDIEGFLRDELALALNPKTTILCAENGIDFCGYRHLADHKTLRRTSVKRIKRTVAAYNRGKIADGDFEKAWKSWEGHASHADAFRLHEAIKSTIHGHAQQ